MWGCPWIVEVFIPVARGDWSPRYDLTLNCGSLSMAVFCSALQRRGRSQSLGERREYNVRVIPQMSGPLSLRRSCALVSPLFCSPATFQPKPQTDNITNNNITRSRSPLPVGCNVISHSFSFTDRCSVGSGEYGMTREMLHTTVATGQRYRLLLTSCGTPQLQIRRF